MTRASRRVAVSALVALLCLAVAGLSSAGAAGLRLAGGASPYDSTGPRCSTGPAVVQPTGTVVAGRYTQVRVTGLTGTCSTGRVIVSTTTGTSTSTVVLDGTGTVTAGAFTATTATPFTPPSSSTGTVFVSVDTWPVPATWTFAPAGGGSCVVLGPNPSGATCAVSFGADTDGRADVYNIKATVTTTSANPVQWQATFDFANLTSFPFVARYVGEYAGNWALQPLPTGFCSGAARVVSYQGLPNRGTQHVSAASPLTLDFVGSLTSPVGNNVVYSCP
ncbi:hypothetical protein Cch01nite_32900 [Cellulomonas chitinilytica]|uniref:Uncharacterized protein n=1 Tax=Cellulomonas chitinilytica TaxID=398759 RepID=A0A919U2Q5_9CELL|nr:hypothetical protein [Cellulomonas chitinilytica]GIG22566.1 hypothetical protein Cch01nite_32900 [Cellulomonas chitinilytica]